MAITTVKSYWLRIALRCFVPLCPCQVDASASPHVPGSVHGLLLAERLVSGTKVPSGGAHLKVFFLHSFSVLLNDCHLQM